MSFEKSMPGKGIAKSAIKTVTATRNSNRKVVAGNTPEQDAQEKKEKESELRAKFDQEVAQEFSQSKSSFQQFQQQSNQGNSFAQLAAMAGLSANASAQPQFKMPQLPVNKNQNKQQVSQQPNHSNKAQQGQSLKKPELVDNKQKAKINPLSKPGQSQADQVSKSREQTDRNTATQSNISPKMAEAVASDANRVSNLRGFENESQSRALSQNLLKSYAQNTDKHSLSEADVRRLVNHGIEFKPKFFNPKNSAKENDELANKLISTKNEAALAKLSDGPKIASHYKSLGFKRGDYSQQTAKQFKESFDYIQSVRKNPDSRSAKQALVLLPEKGAAQFDMVNEVEDLKKLGFTPVFAQIDNENGFKLKNPDGSNTPLKQLGEDLGGFELVVLGGHGQNSKTPGIKFGESIKVTDPKNKSQIAQAEKDFLDEVDFKKDSHIKDFFQDKSILKEGGTLASCSCSFTGSSKDRGPDHIKAQESLAAIIQDIRPDADIMGAFDKVYASDSKYTMSKDGKLENPTMRRLDEANITEEGIAQTDSPEEPSSVDSLIDSLDDIFADDYADELDDILNI